MLHKNTQGGIGTFFQSLLTNHGSRFTRYVAMRMDLIPRADKRDRCGRAEGAPAVAQAARGGFQKGGEKLLGVVVGQGNAEEIGTPRMRIFLVASSMTGSVPQKHLPG